MYIITIGVLNEKKTDTFSVQLAKYIFYVFRATN